MTTLIFFGMFLVLLAPMLLLVWWIVTRMRRMSQDVLTKGASSILGVVADHRAAAVGRAPPPATSYGTDEPIDLDTIAEGSTWVSANGDRFTVVGVANKGSTNPVMFPISIVYQTESGKLLARGISEWLGAMKPSDTSLRPESASTSA